MGERKRMIKRAATRIPTRITTTRMKVRLGGYGNLDGIGFPGNQLQASFPSGHGGIMLEGRRGDARQKLYPA